MNKNYVSQIEPTHFYVNIVRKLYGVCINSKDLSEKDKIIQYFEKTRKQQIEAWEKQWREEKK